MITRNALSISRLAIAICAVLLVGALASRASAESVQWNYVYNGTLCDSGTRSVACGSGITLANPNVAVTEYAQMTNADTGAPIACGSSVPQGTHVELSFPAHSSQDIYWFGTGGDNDTPYGDWSAGASSVSTCVDKNYMGVSVHNDSLYADLAIEPPAESFSGTDGLGCTVSGSSATCNTPIGGTFSPTFNYASTFGMFYGYINDGAGQNMTCSGGAMYSSSDASSPYQLQVDAQQIACPITVIAATSTPAPPVISDDTSTCSADGVPSYSIVSGDSDPSAQIRYGISWDNGGTVEQWVPATGYVTQGTQETVQQVGSGSTFEVLTEDSQGTDSAWVTHTAATCPTTPQTQTCPDGSVIAASASCPATQTCADGSVIPILQTCSGTTLTCPTGQVASGDQCLCVSTGAAPVNGSCAAPLSCPVGYTQQGSTCVFVQCPSGYTQQSDQCVQIVCPAGQQLDSGGNCTTIACAPYDYCGSDGNVWYGDPGNASCTSQPVLSDPCGVYGCSSGACVAPQPGSLLSWSVAPTIVHSGSPTTVTWSAKYVSLCAIGSTNGDSWTCTKGACLDHPAETSNAITGQTIFTITCTGLDGNPVPSKQTIVNILPTFQEQ